MDRVKYTGSKMSRFKAMAAVGIMTAGIMMGAMSNDAHAENYVSVNNSTISGDVMIGGQNYGNDFRSNLNVYNPNSEYHDVNIDEKTKKMFADYEKQLKKDIKEGKVKVNTTNRDRF